MDPDLRQEIHTLHAQLCAGLAEPSLYSLAKSPSYVTELSESLSTPQPTISRHLKVLRERGLAHAERSGQFVTYSLADSRIIQALDLMRAVLADHLRAQACLIDSAPISSVALREVDS